MYLKSISIHARYILQGQHRETPGGSHSAKLKCGVKENIMKLVARFMKNESGATAIE